MAITNLEQAKALSALRTMYSAYKRSADYYDQQSDKTTSSAWNRHRMDDCEMIASILKRIDVIEVEVRDDEVPF